MFFRKWHAALSKENHQRGRTVRRAFPFVIVATLFVGAAIVSENNSYVTITTEPQSVKKGETFFINIDVTAHTAINAIDIELKYPQAQIEVINVDTGNSVITLWAEDPYAAGGIVYLRGGTFGRGFIGDHRIARVRARAIESGTAYVTANDVRFVAGDGSGNDILPGDIGTEKAKIYIANVDGSLVGSASVNIITDIDGDGDVDLSDISAFMAAWFSGSRIFDFNGDGRMTFRDFSILLADSFFN